ncbi:MAG: hypothetical protein SFX72_16765 [Isosphaeraceae bacterium]|nr:hypothetical protein [Isosphaeraceae bacterium]
MIVASRLSLLAVSEIRRPRDPLRIGIVSMSQSFRPALGIATVAASLLLSLAAGCGDAEVGSIKLDDPSKKGIIASPTEGRFKENVPANPKAKKAKGAEEGIESR